ncbi:MAG TPA: EamA family transporter [Gemmatimonadaceae bacterium]|nr:EamA family transporter [Gemmatimonadaceae bacterium]
MTGTTPRFRLVSAFAAVYLIWGSSYLAILWGLETIPPFLLGAARFTSAGVILYVIARTRGPIAFSRVQLLNAAIVGALLPFLGNGSLIWAQQRIPSGIAALIVATVPLWIVVIQTLVEKVRPGAQIWTGVGVGIVGLAILVSARTGVGGAIHLPSALLLCGGAVAWATGSIYSRRADLPKSGIASTALTMLSAGVFFSITTLAVGEHRIFELSEVSVRSLIGLAYLSILGSVVAYSAYIWLLQATTPARVATYAYVNPVIAVLLGWAFANEPISLRTSLAAAVILGAVILITTARQPAQQRR